MIFIILLILDSLHTKYILLQLRKYPDETTETKLRRKFPTENSDYQNYYGDPFYKIPLIEYNLDRVMDGI